MTVRWSREQRTIARRDGLALVTLAVDGREVPLPDGFGMFAFESPVPVDVAREVLRYIERLMLRLMKERRQNGEPQEKPT